MTDALLQQLEDRIESITETVELLRLQIEELETKNARLLEEGNTLKTKQNSWERNLSQMIQKLDILENQATTTEKTEEVTQ